MTEIFKPQTIQPFWSFVHLNFDIVSCFGFRASDFFITYKVCPITENIWESTPALLAAPKPLGEGGTLTQNPNLETALKSILREY